MRKLHNPVLVLTFLLALLLAVPVGPNSAIVPAYAQSRLTELAVTISPSAVTLFAGDTLVFTVTTLNAGDQTAIWSVEEEDGGTITSEGLYTAPKLQGVYHIVATSMANPEKKAVATVTVLAYCDPPHPVVTR